MNTSHVTYKQIMSFFRKFSEEHAELNYFGNGDFFDVVESVKNINYEVRNYPLLWVANDAAEFGDGELTYSFQIIVADIQFDKDGEFYENDIKSNLLLIYQDLLAELRIDPKINNSQVTMFRDGSSSGTSFTERFDDNLVGWVFDIDIRQPLSYNACAIPKN